MSSLSLSAFFVADCCIHPVVLLGWLELIEKKLDVAPNEFSKQVFLATLQARRKKNASSNNMEAKQARASECSTCSATLLFQWALLLVLQSYGDCTASVHLLANEMGMMA